MAYQWSIVLMYLTFNAISISAVKITEISVPQQLGNLNEIFLECHYDLEGEELYSVKWYKDNEEFYRFSPLDTPARKTFNSEGVVVNLQRSNASHLLLSSATPGLYICEVSTGAPTFLTVIRSAEIPMQDPNPSKMPPSAVVIKDDIEIVPLPRHSMAPLCTGCNLIVISDDLKTLLSDTNKETDPLPESDSSDEEAGEPQSLCDECNFLIAQNEEHMKRIIETVIKEYGR